MNETSTGKCRLPYKKPPRELALVPPGVPQLGRQKEISPDYQEKLVLKPGPYPKTELGSVCSDKGLSSLHIEVSDCPMGRLMPASAGAPASSRPKISKTLKQGCKPGRGSFSFPSPWRVYGLCSQSAGGRRAPA